MNCIRTCWLRALLAAIFSLSSIPAWSFLIGPQPPSAGQVVEYFNTQANRYFYTVNSDERNVIEAGGAGPGWVRTGLLFGAFSSVDASRFLGSGCDAATAPCVPVRRFYGPAANSHFFTANAAEAAFLASHDVGWVDEGTAFVAPVPDAAGICPNSAPAPVYRLYNGAVGRDVDHRYTTSNATRAYLLGQGWIDEGVAFCSYWKSTESLDRAPFILSDPAGVQSSSACNSQSSAFDSCVAVANLALPSQTLPGGSDELAGQDVFNLQVGWAMPGRLEQNVTIPAPTRTEAAANTFVQLTTNGGDQLSAYLTTRNRGTSPYSSITPIHKLPTQAPAQGQPDARFFPFRIQYATDYELVMDFNADAHRFSAADAGSAAYGVSSIKFVDARSGHALLLNAAFFATFMPSDLVGVDANSGAAIVGTRFGTGSSYGRFEGDFQSAPFGSYVIEPSFTERIDRTEFAAVLAAARKVDPVLSTDPKDYLVADFRLVNEIYGDGEIGLYMRAPVLSREPAG